MPRYSGFKKQGEEVVKPQESQWVMFDGQSQLDAIEFLARLPNMIPVPITVPTPIPRAVFVPIGH